MALCLAGNKPLTQLCADYLTSEGIEYVRCLDRKGLPELYTDTSLIFISLQFDAIIKPDKFASSELFNIHFSLLPKYRGCYPTAWALINNETETGATLHKIDAGIDTGDIIAQHEVEILPTDGNKQVYPKCTDAGFALFKEWLPKLLSGDYSATPQPTCDEYYTRDSLDFSKITDERLRLY